MSQRVLPPSSRSTRSSSPPRSARPPAAGAGTRRAPPTAGRPSTSRRARPLSPAGRLFGLRRPAGRRPGSRRYDPIVTGGTIWRWRRWLLVPTLLAGAAAGAGLFGLTQIPLPAARPLAQTTFIYDSTGQHVLASFSEQNRVEVKLSQVPAVVIDAVVSTEDRHFFTEGAINPMSIVRAAISDLGGSGNLQGASTITQQYVKQTYLSSERTLSRKVKEAGLAIRVSRTESKRQILQNYLNTIYWGRGAYGIEAAARTYFGVDTQKLNLPEAALLAGMIREPDLADPSRDTAVARQHQLDSLAAMVRDKHITEAQAQAAAAVPFSKFVLPPATGSATAVGKTDTAGRAYFVEAVREQLIAKYGAAEVDGGGLRVTTTMDPTLQSAAYDAVYGKYGLDPAHGTPSGALVSIDDNGEVKALVGGQNYFSGAPGSTVDLALGTAGGGGGRQPGSTFKAFMLAELIKLGYSPLSVFPAPPEVVIPHGNQDGTAWTVKNFSGETAAQPNISLVDATAQSVNTVYAQVVDKLGAADLDAMAAEVGISPTEMHDYPSEVLGTDEVSPLEMAGAYATFADDGIYHTPLLVTRVTDATGRALPLPVTPQTREVLTPAQDAELSYVLQQVVLHGTGTAAGGVGSAVAGKTGTTENSANAWFIGYTPKLTTAVWMGYASGFKPMGAVQGGTIPAHLWHAYMAAALSAEPQYDGTFPAVYSLGGATLTPPLASSLEFPLGMGSTTTSSTSSTSTSVPTSSTTTPKSSTTAPGSPSTSTATTSPPTTVPPTTSTTPTTRPSTTTQPTTSTTKPGL
jgi:membrane peptidoglycan carboxypeptidase